MSLLPSIVLHVVSTLMNPLIVKWQFCGCYWKVRVGQKPWCLDHMSRLIGKEWVSMKTKHRNYPVFSIYIWKNSCISPPKTYTISILSYTSWSSTTHTCTYNRTVALLSKWAIVRWPFSSSCVWQIHRAIAFFSTDSTLGNGCSCDINSNLLWYVCMGVGILETGCHP